MSRNDQYQTEQPILLCERPILVTERPISVSERSILVTERPILSIERPMYLLLSIIIIKIIIFKSNCFIRNSVLDFYFYK